jgi:hypothetical protein
MVTGWIDLVKSPFNSRKKEFVSVDARYDVKKDTRSYEMLSRDTSAVVTPLSPVKSSTAPNGPDYFGETARYQAPARSYSNPRPPQSSLPEWDAQRTYAAPQSREPMNPLAKNRI